METMQLEAYYLHATSSVLAGNYELTQYTLASHIIRYI